VGSVSSQRSRVKVDAVRGDAVKADAARLDASKGDRVKVAAVNGDTAEAGNACALSATGALPLVLSL